MHAIEEIEETIEEDVGDKRKRNEHKKTRPRPEVRKENWKKTIREYHDSKLQWGDDLEYCNRFGKDGPAEQALKQPRFAGGNEVSPACLPNAAQHNHELPIHCYSS